MSGASPASSAHSAFLLVTSLLFSFLVVFAPPSQAAPPSAPSAAFAFSAASPDTLAITSVLWIPPVGQAGRGPVLTDAIELSRVRGTWRTPREGETILPPPLARGFPVPITSSDPPSPPSPPVPLTWTRVDIDSSGVLPVGSGYAVATVTVPEEGIWMLEASGHRHVYVNGEPRVGDFYGYNSTKLPVLLRHGANELLFRIARGPLAARLVRPRSEIAFSVDDLTLPDVIRGEVAPFRDYRVSGMEISPLWIGVPVVNSTEEERRDLMVEATTAGAASYTTNLPTLPRLSMRKMAIQFMPPLHAEGDTVELRLRLRTRAGAELSSIAVRLALRNANEKHKRTFVSDIDGSVQYYAITPPVERSPNIRPSLFLSLHGASVEATNQANAYDPKDWGFVVAPTNRRPYGFDWEDWGRLDALEVLQKARNFVDAERTRVYLTGHSMGGHGVWSLGALFPGEWAAIAPSAGWPDFWSYAGAMDWENPTPVESILRRAANVSRTQLLASNYAQFGIYVLHGDADDNVPVDHARAMRDLLQATHPNFAYHEQPGAGHWWGDECMDWPPLFDFLRANERPLPELESPIDFATVNPGVSAQSLWLEIEQQERSLELSRVKATVGTSTVTLETENVRSLEFSMMGFPRVRARSLIVDSDTLRVSDAPARASGDLGVVKGSNGRWEFARERAASEKSPERSGPFKEAFQNRFVLVYGTRGTPEENAWASAKARYDAEQFWYRGNGSVEVIADRDFARETSATGGNVILYGHADMNSAWGLVHDGLAIDVRRGSVRVGERTLTGDDLACLFVQPRRDVGSIRTTNGDGDWNSVAAVAGTGIAGLRLTDQLPYFVSGVAYPDWTVIGPEMLERGADGVRGLGFFGHDWRYDEGQSAWGTSSAMPAGSR